MKVNRAFFLRIATLGFVVSLALWVVSLSLSIMVWRSSAADERAYGLGLERGCYVWHEHDHYGNESWWQVRWNDHLIWSPRSGFWWDFLYAALPAWIPVAAFATLAILLRAGRRKRPADHCSCGYNLTANTSGRCPECGTPTSNSAATPDTKPTAPS